MRDSRRTKSKEDSTVDAMRDGGDSRINATSGQYVRMSACDQY
jgi:hypothetical protein